MAKDRKDESPFEELKSSARKIWLAGLGAISEAEKRGDEIFQNLVDRGEEYEGTLKEPVGKAGDTFREFGEAARSRASSTFREVETVIERQVSAAMKRMGLATQDEVQSLRAEIRRLKQELESRRPRKAAPGKKKARSSSSRKA